MHGFRIASQDDEPAVVKHVDPGSPAASAGLKAGDSIAAINSENIHSLLDAKYRMLELFKSQSPIHLTLRDGRTVNIPAITIPARSLPVHPTQLYSAIDGALLGWLLWTFYPFRRHDGEAIALLLTIHPITRFLLEVIRIDEPAVFGTGMTISQNVSLILLACGIGLWWYLAHRRTGVVWPLSMEVDGPKRVSLAHQA
jgi:phosphatidylglycerol:prolipoprotein diacylglycerol transferase